MSHVVLLLALIAAGEEDASCDRLSVVNARAIFKTPMFQGKAVRRDAELEVDIASTATAPVTLVELGVFLGATMKTIAETRASALPTARPRELEGGGVAFRVEVPALITPGTTRTLRFTKQTIGLDRDVSSVTAVIAGCRTAVQSGDATVDTHPPGEDRRISTLTLLAFGLGLLIVVVVLIRLLR